MRLRQALRVALPPSLDIEPAGRRDRVRIRIHAGPNRRSTLFQVIPVERLTRSWIEGADRLLLGPPRTLVLYAQASRDAREALRRAGVSYVGERDGRVRLVAPGLYVERDELPQALDSHWAPREADGARSPYAVRTSRVPRWLLLHPKETATITALAAHVELSESAVSRAVRALSDAALIDAPFAADDARRRAVRLVRPRAMLDEWARVWERRRLDVATWDVGAQDAVEAVELLASVSTDSSPARWALGGLAGAARMRRAVDPADALVWVDGRDTVDWLAALLRPRLAPHGRMRGAIRVAIAPDAWVLGLAQRTGGLPIADPVQLWLDCATEGERALEAADAVAEAMGW
jgi:DNA-binding transcriptional ArsR family regulator